MDANEWIVEGPDKTEGPVDLATLRSLDLAGKRVRRVGQSDYLTLEELQAIFASLPGGGVNAPPVQGSEYPRPQYTPPAPHEDPMRFVMPVNPSLLAIAAGYLGLFSTTCVIAPISIFVSWLAFRDLKLNPNKTGHGRAMFGMIMGIIFTLVLIVLVVQLAVKE